MGDTTKLGGILAAKPTKTEAEIAFATRLSKRARSNRAETVDVPGFGPIRLEIVGSRAWDEIESDVDRTMTARNAQQSVSPRARYELERARRTLAVAARDPDDHAKPYGTLEQWEGLDNDEINAVWMAYGDVRERLDPLGGSLGDDERAELEHAFKKKEVLRLRSFGVWKVCAWLITTDALQLISPTPKSEPSPSSSDD